MCFSALNVRLQIVVSNQAQRQRQKLWLRRSTLRKPQMVAKLLMAKQLSKQNGLHHRRISNVLPHAITSTMKMILMLHPCHHK